MASVARPGVTAAALPSGRSRGLGSESAVVLAGRRVGVPGTAIATAAHLSSGRARGLGYESALVLAGRRVGVPGTAVSGAALPSSGRVRGLGFESAVVLAGRRVGVPGIAVAAAALPSSGRARGLGTESAVVLAGLRVGALGRAVKHAQGRRDVKTACAKDQDDADPPRDWDEWFERMYKHRSKQIDDVLGLYMPLPTPLSKEEKAVQDKFKEISENCIALTHDAMLALPHAKRVRVDKVFWQAHFAFAVIRSRANCGRASMEMAVVVADKLHAVLGMVSYGCSLPLPLDMKAKNMLIPFSTSSVFPLDGVEVLVFEMIDNIYKAVKRDIDVMISGVSSA